MIPVGLEPTVDFHHQIKSLAQSPLCDGIVFVRLVGLEPTVEINRLVKSQVL